MAERAHDAYVEPLDGGWRGFQARCWDCDWTGTEFLRGDEPMGTEASRQHKRNARREAVDHSATNRIASGGVTNEMVDRALDAYQAIDGDIAYREPMRAALEAALTSSGDAPPRTSAEPSGF